MGRRAGIAAFKWLMFTDGVTGPSPGHSWVYGVGHWAQAGEPVRTMTSRHQGLGGESCMRTGSPLDLDMREAAKSSCGQPHAAAM